MRYHSLFIHSWVRHLSCSQFWTVMNKAAINHYEQVYGQEKCFQFSWDAPRNGITGSYESVYFISISYFILNCQTVFQNDYTVLNSYLHQCKRISVIPVPLLAFSIVSYWTFSCFVICVMVSFNGFDFLILTFSSIWTNVESLWQILLNNFLAWSSVTISIWRR